jgi:leukotriene-A4 hydrolase
MGGMENPLLTFASPSVIVGDKSQVYVAAHEMAHSWTGNTVTCADWANFWLNEGFTVYFERLSALKRGEDIIAMESAFIGNQSSYNNMVQEGYWSSYASLHPNVRDDLPDNSFTEIPYEKGF